MTAPLQRRPDHRGRSRGLDRGQPAGARRPRRAAPREGSLPALPHRRVAAADRPADLPAAGRGAGLQGLHPQGRRRVHRRADWRDGDVRVPRGPERHAQDGVSGRALALRSPPAQAGRGARRQGPPRRPRPGHGRRGRRRPRRHEGARRLPGALHDRRHRAGRVHGPVPEDGAAAEGLRLRRRLPSLRRARPGDLRGADRQRQHQDPDGSGRLDLDHPAGGAAPLRRGRQPARDHARRRRRSTRRSPRRRSSSA